MSELLLDPAGRRRAPATLPGYRQGQRPRKRGCVIRRILRLSNSSGGSSDCRRDSRRHAAGRRDDFGVRARALIVVLWRAGLRISEALALSETDLDSSRGSLLVRRGKGGRRREIGMDAWGWEQLHPWVEARVALPVGTFFCVISGATRGRPWSNTSARTQLRRLAAQAGVRRRFAPHQLRHAHAVEMAREGIPLNVIQRQLGHANLGITSVYLQGIDNHEIIEPSAPVERRRTRQLGTTALTRVSAAYKRQPR